MTMKKIILVLIIMIVGFYYYEESFTLISNNPARIKSSINYYHDYSLS